MDCHVFRRMCDELVPALLGARVEKIHQPAEGLVQLAVYGDHRKRYLLCKTERRAPFVFLSTHKLSVGMAPPASIMRLRKYLSDRRFVDARTDWIQRVLWLRVQDNPERALPLWLEINLREGLRLHEGEPPFAVSDDPLQSHDEAVWPDAETLSLCTQDRGMENSAVWRDWPVFSPALRRTLTGMGETAPGSAEDNAAERAALLGDLQWGGGDLFVYEGEQGAREVFAWPLPASLRGDRLETVYENALQAVAHVGETEVLARLATNRDAAVAKPYRAEVARLDRLLHKLDSEQVRLSRLAALQDNALALQAEVYRFDPALKVAGVDLLHTEPPRHLALNPSLTVRENMAALFHQVARGRRGLAMLDARRNAVRVALEQVRAQGDMAGELVPFGKTGKTGERIPPKVPTPFAPVPAFSPAGPSGALLASDPAATSRAKDKSRGIPKGVQAFRSTDGLLILRGRDAKGNALLLKLGAPHDVWMHTGLGTGAHVLIRRDGAGQPVSEATLREAGTLAVNKSAYQHAARADVMVAEVRHVRPVKGGKAGLVRVEKQLPSLSVTPDVDMEHRLSGNY